MQALHAIICHMQANQGGRAAQQQSLRRALSLPLVTFYGLGHILGAGIYVLIGKVAGAAGLFTPLSFLLAALLACLTAFTYAELSARFPLSAGEAVYVQEGLGVRLLPSVVGILIVLAGIVSAATIMKGFAGYLQVFVPVPAGTAIPLMLLLLGGLAGWGIAESVAAAALVTVVEVAGLLLIIGVAAPGMGMLNSVLAEGLPPLTETAVLPGILMGAFLAFYAFIGFEDMVNVAEEVRQPERNLPRAILLALLISSVLYLLVSLAAITSLPVERLATADAPLAVLYESVTGREPVLITLISMIAVVNGALIQIIMASRVSYGMARLHWLPACFGRVHPRTRTPVMATITVTVLVLLAALWFPIETLAKATSFFLLIVFALVNLSLWRLKRRIATGRYNTFTVPRWVPACGFFASMVFVVVQAMLELAG
jgi:APA family basic amino acid/polyamine antiporter